MHNCTLMKGTWMEVPKPLAGAHRRRFSVCVPWPLSPLDESPSESVGAVAFVFEEIRFVTQQHVLCHSCNASRHDDQPAWATCKSGASSLDRKLLVLVFGS